MNAVIYKVCVDDVRGPIEVLSTEDRERAMTAFFRAFDAHKPLHTFRSVTLTKGDREIMVKW